ncbi:TetR/AcrR family transcriptional regulator [Streptomyces sp. SM11]|uniref:TetR/AcrR family transcriptional regulator n=1 Tax=Streptomyces sp. SM11 TaxID=565557 RepID=UPI000CD52114|nr:TetR/AcrR family transcriptional regulator [Streptomyces sp. SM11]
MAEEAVLVRNVETVAIVRTRGADGLTLVTLAEEAGVSRPIAFDHFATRPGLLLALYQRLDERHRAAIMQVLRGAALIARLLAGTCEICGSKGNVQVHHARALADLAHAGWQPSDWARVMLQRRRKTVVDCDVCHDRIHSEQPVRTLTP